MTSGIVDFGTLQLRNTSSGSISNSVNTDTVKASGGLTLDNAGIIRQTGSKNAVHVTSGAADITNEVGGTISSNGGPAIQLDNGMSNATIHNTGLIEGTNVTYAQGLGVRSLATTTSVSNGLADGSVAAQINGGYIGVEIGSGTITNYANSTIHGGWAGLHFGTAQVVNYGTISGSGGTGATFQYGMLVDDAGSVITNYGTISGADSAIMLNNANNTTINIYDGAVFTNGIDYNNKTGNTTNFYTGSYTLGVKNYQLNTNTINLRGTAQTLVTSGLVNGNGDIIVVDNSAPLSANSAGAIVAGYTSSVISDLLSNDVIVQDIGIGDVFPRDSVNDQSQSSVKAGFYPDRLKLRTSKAQAAFANVLASSAATKATGSLLNGSGQALDRYGNLVWSRSFGGAYFQDPFGGVSGQRTYSGGTMVGYDWHNEVLRVGGFFGLGKMRTNRSLSLDHVTTDTFFGGVYGRYSFDKFKLDATLSGGSINATTQRYINNGNEVATGKVNGFFLSPEVALGYDMAVADGWVFTPTGRLRYVGAFSDPYTETGSSQNVSYGKSVSQSFEEHLELRLTHNVKDDRGLISSYYLQAAAIAAQRVGPDGFAANLAGTSFTVGNGAARAKAGGSITAGFNYKLTQQCDLFGSVETAAYSDKSYSFAVRGGVKVAF